MFWNFAFKLRSCVAGSLLTILAVFSQAAVSQTFEPLDLSGGELFQRYCAACHGVDARGTGPVAATLNKRVPDLTRLAVAANGEFQAELIRDAIDGRAMSISHGTRQMPVWGYEFWVEEGADVVAEQAARALINRIVIYLESIQIGSEPAGFN